MSRVAIRLTGPRALERARAVLDELNRSSAATRAGGLGGDLAPLPRCDNRWRWATRPGPDGKRGRAHAGLIRGRGRLTDCPCTSETDPHPDCPHTTWQVAEVYEDGAAVVLELRARDLALAAAEDPGGHGLPLERRLPAPEPVTRNYDDDGRELDGEGRPRPARAKAIDLREERRALVRTTVTNRARGRRRD